jgi:predicted PurR-regulated permease PerM
VEVSANHDGAGNQIVAWARAVFIPLMLGVMISYALSPPVNLMQKWHIPRAIGAAVLLAIVGGTGSQFIRSAIVLPS